MEFIKPTEITDSLFLGATLPETDYPLWLAGTTYLITSRVVVATPNIHKIYESLTNSNTGNYPPGDTTNWLEIGATNRWKCFDGTLGTQAEGTITPDILDEDCADISDWTDDDTDTGASEVDPAGQFRFDTNTGAAGNARSGRKQTITSPPTQFTLEVKMYFDALGTAANGDNAVLSYTTPTWKFGAYFSSNIGLQILKNSGDGLLTTVCTLKCNETAAWQTFRFEVDRSAGDASATVDVYVEDVLQGTFNCDFESTSMTDGELLYHQYGNSTNDRVSHIDYIKIATGLGAVDTAVTTLVYAITPGAVDSVALLNIESTSVEIDEIDEADDLITNGEDWTGATGTTQPNSWNKVATPSDFTIDGGALQITADASNEGVSQTITVSAATKYQLLFLYKNTSGDIAQVAVYDATHSANILATTDLASSTEWSVYSYVFTTPAGCTSIRISLLAKASGDIVWFDYVKLAPTEYSETVTTGTSKTDLVKTDLVQKAAGIITVTVNYTAGTPKLGELIVGVKTSLGTMRYSPTIGITDYSTKEVDVYGHYSIVQRSFAKRMTCSLIILNTDIDEVVRLLSLYRSTELVWIGDANYNSLIIYGYYKDFQVIFSRPLSSDCSLEIEGLT